jgi:hypothetical protein
MKLRKSALALLRRQVGFLPVANTSDHTTCNVLAKRKRRALDDFSNHLNAEADNDTPFPAEHVAKEEGEHCTDQTSKIP